MVFVPHKGHTHQHLIGTFRAAKSMVAEIIGPGLQRSLRDRIPRHAFPAAKVHFAHTRVDAGLQVAAQGAQGMRELLTARQRRDAQSRAGWQGIG